MTWNRLLGVLIFVCIHGTVSSETRSYSFNVQRVPGAPDGYPRPVIAVYHNESERFERPFPGPLIRVKKGDEVLVKFNNRLESSQIGIHFHGLHMRRNPWMDGSPGITECGINPRSSFTYRFDTTQTGTFWYHSHAGAQYGDGLLGPIIVDYPDDEQDPVQKEFPHDKEKDVVILLQDWLHETGEDVITHSGAHGSYPGFTPKFPWPTTSLLINGIGRGPCNIAICNQTTSVCDYAPQCLPLRHSLMGTCNATMHPLDEFQCSGNYTKFRIINGASNVPLRFWIDRHNLTVVSRDGIETIPIEKRCVNLPVGQRLDVMVKCSQDSQAKYRIFVTMATNLIPGGIVTTPKIYAEALLVYPTVPTEVPTDPEDLPMIPIADPDISPFNRPFDDPIFEDDVLFEFSLAPLEPAVAEPAVRRIVLVSQVTWSLEVGSHLEEWMLNDQVFTMPTEPILPAVYKGSRVQDLQVEKTGNHGQKLKTFIETLESGKTYEIVLIENDMQMHPWHLHGYSLQFIAAGFLPNTSYGHVNMTDPCGSPLRRIKNSEISQIIPFGYDTSQPVIAAGDTFNVPAMGYVVFRIKAVNEGPWLLHCHVSWHLAMGMAMILSVENDGRYRDIILPPEDLPVCGRIGLWKNTIPVQLENPDFTIPSLEREKQLLFAGLVVGTLGIQAVAMVMYFICRMRGYDLRLINIRQQKKEDQLEFMLKNVN